MTKNIVRCFNLIVGCLFIAIALNLFVIPNNFVTFGATGLSTELFYISNVSPALNILLIHIAIMLLGILVFDAKYVSDYFLSALVLPLCIFFTEDLPNLISINITENLMIVVIAGFLIGSGYSMMYRNGYKAGSVFLLEEIIGKLTRFHSKHYSVILDIILVIGLIFIKGYMAALYSIILIFFSKEMIKKARFGINDSKMFYVITNKEKEVKELIIRIMKSELTLVDVKGGFTKKENKVIATVISTENYYRLKEGIKSIDPKAFIIVTDTYDVINKKAF